MKTQTILQHPAILLAVFLVLIVTSCEVEKEENKPVVATNEVTAIKSTEALCGGVITSDGGFTITSCGVCWSTDSIPTINDNKTTDSIGAGCFTSQISGLQPKSNYYVRAYATNSEGTGYGMAMAFETIGAAVLTTAEVTEISYTTAVCGGAITSDGEQTIIDRGVCWSTSPDSVELEKASGFTVNGSGIGTFESELTNLSPGINYYVRAYATNSIETNYGNIISFQTTELQSPTLTTRSIVWITPTMARSEGYISSDGGAWVYNRGVCWSTDPNPTIDDNKTSDGTGTGFFSSTLTKLSPSTTYYLRAYATNSIGTGYGEEVLFTTKDLPENSFIDSRDGNIYQYVSVGSQVWMAENLKYLPGVVAGGGSGSTTTPYYYVNGYDGTIFSEDKLATNYQNYGVLYNWPAAMAGSTSGSSNPSGMQGICPTGWHLPSDAEWTELTDYLGGESVAGGKLKVTGTGQWKYPNIGATNEVGFSALPGGHRSDDGLLFSNIGPNGYWWCATESGTNDAWCRDIYNGSSEVGRFSISKESGLSVRCVKD